VPDRKGNDTLDHEEREVRIQDMLDRAHRLDSGVRRSGPDPEPHPATGDGNYSPPFEGEGRAKPDGGATE
jgi:hypothetical protein